jgi:hypothetical protein
MEFEFEFEKFMNTQGVEYTNWKQLHPLSENVRHTIFIVVFAT